MSSLHEHYRQAVTNALRLAEIVEDLEMRRIAFGKILECHLSDATVAAVDEIKAKMAAVVATVGRVHVARDLLEAVGTGALVLRETPEGESVAFEVMPGQINPGRARR